MGPLAAVPCPGHAGRRGRRELGGGGPAREQGAPPPARRAPLDAPLPRLRPPRRLRLARTPKPHGQRVDARRYVLSGSRPVSGSSPSHRGARGASALSRAPGTSQALPSPPPPRAEVVARAGRPPGSFQRSSSGRRDPSRQLQERSSGARCITFLRYDNSSVTAARQKRRV